MKLAKILIVLIVIFVGLVALLGVWINLPVSLRYSKEIKFGNKFVDNIRRYQKENNKLPDEMEWSTLKKLSPIMEDMEYKEWYPEYKKIDENDFTITYVEGFDGPYLMYDTRRKKWTKDFPEHD